ncbi:MAG: HAD hydrolase family protein [Rhodanobacteraceae bacterium]|jgi:3-deoxy-D-manno-octulosonate 8-phosphate phosphatase (KDO 8-P phosphatase)|nr:HAD hydrolase family protein [Rhodanobacteraceae bacterium]MBL0041240.1 HAD hydrolase family protein [Xanthomonadales bacterium]MBP6077993.1 HAD hydrolase family protein [Xanthomonadales bacterium]MBP7623386.1 HAD hydrolase family protein [Xanthomonadales bacterium]
MTSWSPLTDLPDHVRDRAARVRLVCFDVDGVMTDGGLYYSDVGHEAKRFHVLDGLGLKMLLESGVHVAVITARDTPAVAQRMRDLGIRHVFAGVPDKRARMLALAAELGLGIEDVAHVGDDLPDLGILSTVGFAITVANAHPSIVGVTHWQTRRHGGDGAVREVCDVILAARGLLDAAVARFRP